MRNTQKIYYPPTKNSVIKTTEFLELYELIHFVTFGYSVTLCMACQAQPMIGTEACLRRQSGNAFSGVEIHFLAST